MLGDDYGQLLQMYLQEAPDKVSAITQAIQQGNLETTRSLAHNLKGSSLAIGVQALATVLGQLESHAAKGEGAAVQALEGELATRFAETQALLKHFIEDALTAEVR